MIWVSSIPTRKVEGKSSKKFGFFHLQKSGFGREPQNEPQDNLRVQKSTRKVRKNTGFLIEIRCFYGCGGRTRTYDLRAMRQSQAQIGVISAPFCAFYRHSFGEFSIVSVQACPLFSDSGSKLGQDRVTGGFQCEPFHASANSCCFL